MAKVIHPLFGFNAAGTLAKTLVYRSTRTGHTVYPYVAPCQPGSDLQVNHQILFSLLATAWGQFTPGERAYWNPVARFLSVTNYNAYLSYNLDRLNSKSPQALVGWWPAICPTGDTLYDLSPYAHPGSWIGPSDHWAPSPYGRVPSFAPPQAFFDCGDYALFQLEGNFTLAYWYRSGSNANQIAMSKWTGMGTGSQWWLGSLAGNNAAGVYGPPYGSVLFNSGLPHGTGRWTHVALVREGSTGHLYVDAVDCHARLCTPDVVGHNAAPMTIGDYNGVTGAWPFVGLLYDLRIYARALSPAEVQGLALN